MYIMTLIFGKGFTYKDSYPPRCSDTHGGELHLDLMHSIFHHHILAHGCTHPNGLCAYYMQSRGISRALQFSIFLRQLMLINALGM